MLVPAPRLLFAQVGRVEIDIQDYADLSRNSLHELAGSMQHILTSGNELVHVMTSPTSAASRCTRSHGRTRSLQVRILPDAPNKTGAQPIPGEVFLRSGRGRYATVFLHAAQQQASEASVPWMVVLAYAGSHRASAARGSSYTSRVMKAHWNRSDYESMNQSGFHFSLDQVRHLALITTRNYQNLGTSAH